MSSGLMSFILRSLGFLSMGYCLAAHAQFLKGVENGPSAPKERLKFLIPNEQYPRLSKELIEEAPKGLYISVGSERSFLGVAMAQAADHLLIVDYDPAIVRFGKINTALLELAESREEYLKLRLKSSLSEWKKILGREEKKRRLSEESQKILRDTGEFKWWKENVRNNAQFEEFHTSAPYRREEFKEVNYLFNDAAFLKLSKMAREGRIQSISGDLGDKTFADRLRDSIKNAKLNLSVLDISNAFWQLYMTEEGLGHLLTTLQPVADPKALLFVTQGMHRDWVYYSFDFSLLSNGRAAARALQNVTEARYEGYPAIHNPYHTVKAIRNVAKGPCDIFSTPALKLSNP